MSDGTDAACEEILPLHREDLVAGKRVVERVCRVETVTEVREQRVGMPLRHERVEIARVPVDRFVEAMPDIRREGELTIMPVVDEVLVVERRLLLREEVHIRRVTEVEQHTETLELRTQEFRTTRRPAAAGDTSSNHTATGDL